MTRHSFQVKLVREFRQSLNQDVSLVKQMLMGGGKTTVVSPLLTLMLADGNALVMQVVPGALLEFSRSILRKIFSSIMRKRIFTFTFDRGSDPNGGLVRKLQNAIRTGGIVVASSVAVKSVMLKFVESLDMLDDPARLKDKEVWDPHLLLGFAGFNIAGRRSVLGVPSASWQRFEASD